MPHVPAFPLCFCAFLISIVPISISGRSATRKVEKYLETRDNERVSWKECNLSDGERLDCGFYGVDEEVCYQRGCCWGESKTPGVPWCYHSIPTIKNTCTVDPIERLACGWYGIRKEQCLASDCCWQPNNVDGAPWCYHLKRVPVYEGECGVPVISPKVLSRIVGGEEVIPHSWPWMVSLQGDRGHFCGGSLINRQWLISAAHCEGGYSDVKEVVLGLHSQSDPEASQQRFRVVKVISHPDYRTELKNDIMVVKLENPVNFTDSISPVCVPDEGYEMTVGSRCYTTGWGTLQSGGESPDKLQQVMVPILSNEKCNQANSYNGSVDESEVCAGYEEGGRDSCQGDSGGPLVCYEEDSWALIGVVSWGHGCAFMDKPGVYSEVAHNIKWVERTIAENK